VDLEQFLAACTAKVIQQRKCSVLDFLCDEDMDASHRLLRLEHLGMAMPCPAGVMATEPWKDGAVLCGSVCFLVACEPHIKQLKLSTGKGKAVSECAQSGVRCCLSFPARCRSKGLQRCGCSFPASSPLSGLLAAQGLSKFLACGSKNVGDHYFKNAMKQFKDAHGVQPPLGTISALPEVNNLQVHGWLHNKTTASTSGFGSVLQAKLFPEPMVCGTPPPPDDPT
jgi:hypothetical protein